MRKTRRYWKRYNRRRYAAARALAVGVLGGRCLRCEDERGPFEIHHVNGGCSSEWAALPSFTRYKIVVLMSPEERRAEFALLCEPCHVAVDPAHVGTTTRRRRHK